MTTLGPDSALFLKALAAVEVPPPDQPVIEGVPQCLYVPMTKAAIDCADQISASARAEALDVGSNPRKSTTSNRCIRKRCDKRAFKVS
ncbi:MAG: hypothetical protein V7647_1791 [Acidobacteriota bacterium]